jgi:hypothetical protein
MYKFGLSFALLTGLALAHSPLMAQDVSTEIDASAVAKPKNIYPTSILARPFTLPVNSFEAGIKFKAGTTATDSFYSLNSLELKYGITNDFEAGLSWSGLHFSKPTDEHSVSLNLGYFLFANRFAAGMAALSVPFHFNGDVFRSATLAAPTSITLIRQTLTLMVLHGDLAKLNYSSKDGVSAEFAFPFQVAFQAHPNWYFNIETQLGRVKTVGGHEHLLNKTPLHAKALFAINNGLDVVAVAGFDDTQKASETFSVVLGLSFRGGALDG